MDAVPEQQHKSVALDLAHGGLTHECRDAGLLSADHAEDLVVPHPTDGGGVEHTRCVALGGSPGGRPLGWCA
jgi:hypothetical protein